ncbi:hypothetical protein [Haloarchaeobius iranensis]|uniref:Uncharacterized protein n=1 Tax=Haloarchaeobius iranensis TaxID=996166 RepID=A0A1G9V2I6_9EURY|nr:hypothetical protein [Haloarchaeobius iranensis]SDM66491.1 hypothetical protein SAMN05192554_105161 [Haloarchaeobius iranensis]
MSDATEATGLPIAPETVGRAFAALSGLLGLVFLATPVTSDLGSQLDPAGVVPVVYGLAVGFGLCLVAISWLGRDGRRPLATVAPALLAAALLVLGPGLGYPLSAFNWAGLLLASVVFGGLGALWTLVYG